MHPDADLVTPGSHAPAGLDLVAMAQRIVSVDGVVGVILGGSRARGDHAPDSDVDLGIYYEGDLDVAALAAVARDVAGPDAQVTAIGGWGPWVDGGAWLVVDGVHVDWIYRDLDRVREAWARAHRGTYDWNTQVGHPLGVPDFAYVGEVALGVILADPDDGLRELKDAITYPDALETALTRNLWEADFLCVNAGKATSRGDTTYVALCLSRAMLLCAHALHGHERRWLVNEKGAVAAAGRLASAPTGFADHAQSMLAALGASPDELPTAVAAARALVAEVAGACDVTV